MLKVWVFVASGQMNGHWAAPAADAFGQENAPGLGEPLLTEAEIEELVRI